LSAHYKLPTSTLLLLESGYIQVVPVVPDAAEPSRGTKKTHIVLAIQKRE
jgi:hypothetical protein